MRVLRIRLLRFARRSDVLIASTIVLLLVATIAVYLAGGTQSSWPHLFYVPVVGAAATWGMRAGLLTALSAGVLCGPLMPLDVATDTPQTFGGWMLRTLFFILVAAAAAAGRERLVYLTGARQELLAAVSHEIRTPLSAVLGFSELVLDRYDELTDTECREFAALIRQEAVELSDIIDHYMVAGRIEYQMSLETVDVDLRHVIDIVLMGVPAEIRQSRIEANGHGVHVVADPLRLRQIVRALVNNALAYGGDRVFILIGQDAGYGTVTVSGIRQELVAVRKRGEHPSVAPLGVGLAVARKMTEMMGGRLIYRLHGDGSFVLQLPLDSSSSRTASARP